MQFMKSNNKIDEIFKFNEVEIVIVNNKKTELFLNNLKHMML